MVVIKLMAVIDIGIIIIIIIFIVISSKTGGKRSFQPTSNGLYTSVPTRSSLHSDSDFPETSATAGAVIPVDFCVATGESVEGVTHFLFVCLSYLQCRPFFD